MCLQENTACLKFECSRHASFLNNRTTSTFKAFGLLGACPSRYECEKMLQMLRGSRHGVMPLKHGSLENFNNFVSFLKPYNRINAKDPSAHLPWCRVFPTARLLQVLFEQIMMLYLQITFHDAPHGLDWVSNNT
jgi:hypothetical protein